MRDRASKIDQAVDRLECKIEMLNIASKLENFGCVVEKDNAGKYRFIMKDNFSASIGKNEIRRLRYLAMLAGAIGEVALVIDITDAVLFTKAESKALRSFYRNSLTSLKSDQAKALLKAAVGKYFD